MSGKILTEVIQGHLKKINYTSTNSTTTLDKNILVHNTSNIPANSGCGLMPKLFLAGMSKDTASVHITYNHTSQHH